MVYILAGVAGVIAGIGMVNSATLHWGWIFTTIPAFIMFYYALRMGIRVDAEKIAKELFRLQQERIKAYETHQISHN